MRDNTLLFIAWRFIEYLNKKFDMDIEIIVRDRKKGIGRDANLIELKAYEQWMWLDQKIVDSPEYKYLEKEVSNLISKSASNFNKQDLVQKVQAGLKQVSGYSLIKNGLAPATLERVKKRPDTMKIETLQRIYAMVNNQKKVGKRVQK